MTIKPETMEQTPQEFFKEIASKGKQYTLVFLIEGSNRDQDEATADEIQFNHLKYLMTLREQGILPMHGPLLSGGKIVGVGVYNSTDLEQVKKWCEGDPGFKAGRFTYEYHPFFTFPGSTIP
jgi:uncharacterized protein YciI